MKSDTERKRFHNAKLHEKSRRMHVHLSKELRAKLKRKKRSVLVRVGDKVRVMRGSEKGKLVKVARVSHAKMKVYCEGVVHNTAKGREVLRALQPSNLLLMELEQTKERKELFSDAAFRREEKKAEAKPEAKAKPEGKPEAKAEQKPVASAKPEAHTGHRAQDTVPKAPEAAPAQPAPAAGKR